MAELVTVEIKDYVADVRLNRAEKMNALSIPMFEEITRVGKELAHNKEVRAIVLSGEGRGFCAGLDLANFTDADFWLRIKKSAPFEAKPLIDKLINGITIDDIGIWGNQRRRFSKIQILHGC